MERFAVIRPQVIKRIKDRPRIWIHAVSVGEVYVALQFIAEFRAAEPNAAFVLTTVTSTGHAVAEERLSPDDVLLYFPVDFPPIVKRELDIILPRAVILVESELWPNLIRLATERQIPVVLVNGRISSKSAKGYGIVKPFFARGVNMISLLCVQSKYDGDRLQELGARQDRIKVMGAAKYDSASADADAGSRAERILSDAGVPGDLVLLGASTWPGEERILLRLYKELREQFQDLRLVLAPRHFERAASICAEIEDEGLAYVRRSALADTSGEGHAHDVLLVDTTGEMSVFYACASVIFVGKSLTMHGGQSIIEPAPFGKPIITGPNLENFPGVVDDFREAGVLLQVPDSAGLHDMLAKFLSDQTLRVDHGDRTRRLIDRKRGVIRATVELIRQAVLPNESSDDLTAEPPMR